jgi:hypothetical protein
MDDTLRQKAAEILSILRCCKHHDYEIEHVEVGHYVYVEESSSGDIHAYEIPLDIWDDTPPYPKAKLVDVRSKLEFLENRVRYLTCEISRIESQRKDAERQILKWAETEKNLVAQIENRATIGTSEQPTNGN